MVKFVSILVLLLFGARLRAQTDITKSQNKTVSDSNRAAILFERNVFTYRWSALTNYSVRDSSFELSLGEQFASSFIKRGERSFRDENTLNLDGTRHLSPQLSFRAQTESYLLSGSQYLSTNNVGIHSVVAGVTYQPLSNVSLTPLIGVRFDKQVDVGDNGVNLRFLFDADSLEFSGYRTTMIARINESTMKPRSFRNNGAAFSINKEFAEGAVDSVRVRYLNNQWDFYIKDDTIKKYLGNPFNIRSRTENIFGIQNMIAYDVNRNISLRLNANVESRKIGNSFRYKYLPDPSSISFNTDVQEFRLEGSGDMDVHFEDLFASFGLAVAERDEKHSVETIDGVDQVTQETNERREHRLDNTAFRTTLRSNVMMNLSSSDIFTFDGAVNMLRYDTPDTLNTDDRDELLITLSAKEHHRFSDAFEASVVAEATLGHLVYLLRDKSANNNWNRIIRLMPECYYHPADNFRMYNSFEVLANYTVFDFELVIPSVKSYSYRQFAFLDSTSYDMTNRIGFDLTSLIRIYERGEFRWTEFSERPEQYVEEVTFSPQVRWTNGETFSCAFGFRSFAQKKYFYVNNERQYNCGYISAGPTTRISIFLSHRSRVEISGWKEFQRQSGTAIQEFSNMTMNVQYNF